jgi:hypothetical protein
VHLPKHDVGADPVAGLEQDDVAHDQLRSRQALGVTVADRSDLDRQQVTQPPPGLVSPELLGEGEDRVQHDDDRDRHRELRHAR